MGRKPSTNLNLPPHMRKKKLKTGDFFYYEDPVTRKWIALGKDYIQALREYADLAQGNVRPPVITFKYAADRYFAEVVPTKKPGTQQSNIREYNQLSKFFCGEPPAPLDEIEPINIRQYLDWRKDAKVRANREIALFSHIFNLAREWGYTNKENPARGVRKNKETGRDVYVDDQLFQKVYQAADQSLRDAMDLSYLTGQRPADVLKIRETDIIDGELYVKQNKTEAKLRIAIIGRLEELISRLRTRKRQMCVITPSLLINEKGEAFTYHMLRRRFDIARAAAGIEKNEFRFMDLRAKAATDKEDSQGMEAAQTQLGHTSASMTNHYVRHKLGKKVTPTK